MIPSDKEQPFALRSIQVVVSDLGSTEAFYAGILDLPVRPAVPGPVAVDHLVLEKDGWKLVFVEEDGVARGHGFLERQFSDNRRGVGIIFHFTVEHIEAIYDALLDENIEIVYPLREHPYGVKDLWCYDPDGYLVVLEERFTRPPGYLQKKKAP